MGMLFRMLAPKPLKKARRAMNPLGLVTGPIHNVTHPLGAPGRAVKREIVRETLPIRRRQRPKTKAARKSGMFFGCWVTNAAGQLGQVEEVLPDGTGRVAWDDRSFSIVQAP
jgi:hypothetical protein